MRWTVFTCGSLLLLTAAGLSQAPHNANRTVQMEDDDAVLTRNIDKRPLPTESLDALSPAMRRAVEAILAEFRSGEVDPHHTFAYTLQRIPVPSKDHKLHLLAFIGWWGCDELGPNCREVLFDETAAGVDTVDDDGMLGITVVRRPHLQLPDIAEVIQLGHFAINTVVLRFNGTQWEPFRCAQVPIAETLKPKRLVADKPCTTPDHASQPTRYHP